MSEKEPLHAYSIGDLAREFGVTYRTIRYYESCGLIFPRRHGRRRLYTPRERVRLKLIMRGKRLGFTLDEIREVLDLYDAAPGEAGQLRFLLGKIRGRRSALERQRQDIEIILDELDRIESQCVDALSELTDTPSDNSPTSPNKHEAQS